MIKLLSELEQIRVYKKFTFVFGKIDKTLLRFLRIRRRVLCVLSRVMSVRKIAWRVWYNRGRNTQRRAIYEGRYLCEIFVG